MQRQIYECDQCKTEIGNKKHISMVFAKHMRASGIANPPQIDPDNHGLDFAGISHWHITQDLSGRFIHFCSSKCLERYFAALLKGADKKVLT